MWREKVDVGDGAYIFLYHTNNCRKERPFLSTGENMINYQKLKCDVFDFCFSEEQLKMLSEISRYNIAEYENNALDYCENKIQREYYYSRISVLDTGNCEVSTKYAMQDGQLVKLKYTWMP